LRVSIFVNKETTYLLTYDSAHACIRVLYHTCAVLGCGRAGGGGGPQFSLRPPSFSTDTGNHVAEF